MASSHVWLDHSIVGQPPELEIRRDRSFTFCRICGAIFQPTLHRLPDEEYNYLCELAGKLEELEWAQKHNRTHHTKEHLALAASGLFLMPDAAYKLTPFGIVPLSDAVGEFANKCVVEAMREAPRCPTDSPETTLRRR